MRCPSTTYLLVAALAVAASASTPAQSQSPRYAAPEYVAALIGGDAAKLATRDARIWDAELARAAKESGMRLGVAETLLKMEQAGPIPKEAGSRETYERALETWQGRKMQQLTSTYRRRLVFRSHYIFAFAAALAARCRMLPENMGAGVTTALTAATKALGQAIRPDGSLSPRAIEDAEGAQTLAAWIKAGESDANGFMMTNACTSPATQAVANTLKILLSAPTAGPKPNEDMIVRERNAMTGLPDDWFLLDGLYLRDAVPGNPYPSVSRAAAEVATWYIPRPEDEIPGKIVGWRSDMSGIAAGRQDSKPILFVLSSPSVSCSECRTAIRDMLRSGPLNLMAGRFHAMIVTLDGIPESPSSPLRSRLGVNSNVAVILVRLGDKDRNAQELLRQEGKIDIRALERDLERQLGTTRGTAADIGRIDRPPSFCWLIEDFEMCQARIQRAGPAE